ncbi:transcriptional regulator [Paenibacillus polymyxa]|uniref:transcriptional regulator n=1 Tax=Paenibacillus polymyxa TaxID=1406 RepID=UPI00202412CF|nr:transcriptional regulator [Paenibacillus polymyxa]MDU8675347.1 transcriptional regulator [Paenibacillus polymyxa]MDU8700254.1 transcriptional regulator [Paenibacillus polymyxa]URJ54871.1 transcriptional regulator [Paenibacillus polymyxa]URJ66714.1 transcriptional regulator [Paenibacillus polymyxa]URJ69384.1 transcriptional regulator [Paenibacillus polymyxa]
MKITPTIRAELEQFLQQEDLTLSQFGQIAGMNRGAVSAIVSGNKSMSVKQLDLITEAMGLPEGYYYDLFIENFIIDHPPNMRRIEPFLYRCAELDKLDAIRRVVGAIMDNLLYSPKLFEIAEGLLAQERLEAALILYEGVAEAEKYQHSERLAICQYRIFKIQISDDQSQNVGAAAVFEAFVERLDEIEQLDALKDLANVYRSLRKWDKVDEMAKKMRAKAEIHYSMKHKQNSRMYEESSKKLSRPLFVYITYADLLCANVCEELGDYEGALHYTNAYSNLDWVRETDEDALHWMKLYLHWSKANILANKLLSGDVSVLHEYLNFIDDSSDTIQEDRVTQLLNIMTAANRYKLDVNDILKRFETEIASLSQRLSSDDMYTQQVLPDYSALCGYELAYYYLNQGMYNDGFNHLFCSMVKAHILNNETYFINCMGLFVRFKAHAVPETKTEFYNLIEKVWLNNVEKSNNADRCE